MQSITRNAFPAASTTAVRDGRAESRKSLRRARGASTGTGNDAALALLRLVLASSNISGVRLVLDALLDVRDGALFRLTFCRAAPPMPCPLESHDHSKIEISYSRRRAEVRGGRCSAAGVRWMATRGRVLTAARGPRRDPVRLAAAEVRPGPRAPSHRPRRASDVPLNARGGAFGRRSREGHRPLGPRGAHAGVPGRFPRRARVEEASHKPGVCGVCCVYSPLDERRGNCIILCEFSPRRPPRNPRPPRLVADQSSAGVGTRVNSNTRGWS